MSEHRPLKAAERRRLREVWRSAGWPWQDVLELELLAAGLLERRVDGEGRPTVQLSASGVAALAAASDRHRSALMPHQALVQRVARQLVAEGRVAWCGLSLRAPLPQGDSAAVPPSPALWEADEAQGPLLEMARPPVRWVVAMPDVFSVRITTLAMALEPLVHEIKVRRADLLADLRLPDKGAAYRALAGRCVYVLAEGIAEPEEIPAEFGVMLARDDRLELLRPAAPLAQPAWPAGLPFATWLSLARARPEEAADEPAQHALQPELPLE